MKPRDQHKEPAANGTPPQRPRFRIQKLEERIAPKKGGRGFGTKFCDSYNKCTYTCGG